MLLVCETLALCAVFFVVCYANTGTDEKNAKSFDSYPEAVQRRVLADLRLSDLAGVHALDAPRKSVVASFAGNVLTFTVILFVLGLPLKTAGFTGNFLQILVMGEVLNLFDLLVIDLIWWRNSPRVRFTGTKESPELYRDPGKHVSSFLRGAAAFAIVAAIVGALLTALP